MNYKFIRVPSGGDILPINVDHIMLVVPYTDQMVRCQIVISDGRSISTSMTTEEVMALIEENQIVLSKDQLTNLLEECFKEGHASYDDAYGQPAKEFQKFLKSKGLL